MSGELDDEGADFGPRPVPVAEGVADEAPMDVVEHALGGVPAAAADASSAVPLADRRAMPRPKDGRWAGGPTVSAERMKT
ncbi:hypothetical protein [Nonomuraea wenchangensis]|uniref:hypothetical protein n=1 Tax=Nonomuraea wenchangensis TaxID=568860 RepID=UPI0011603362|nr:hypothetical protein [Nonomuraea wenchangensis]